MPVQSSADIDAIVGEEVKLNKEEPHFPTDNALPPSGKARARAGARKGGKVKMKSKTKDGDKIDAKKNAKLSGGLDSARFNELKQRALNLVHKGSEEIAHRYAHAYDDMKDVSKKVSESMKGKPYQLAMGAAGVVGLGMVLAKKYSQNRSVKSRGASLDSMNP